MSTSRAEAPASLESWHDAVLDQERRGELLTAFDLAERGLEQHPGDVWLKHRAVLALARAGATVEAERRFSQHGLESSADDDVAALGARIAKDLALTAAQSERARRARAAAELYARIFERTRGYYPAVNAATLLLLAGDVERSREFAREALAGVGESREDAYYAAASAGEAHLLLGEEDAARRALEVAATSHGGDYGALATTRRQLRMVCELTGTDTELLGLLAGPAVAHFCGHRVESGGGSAAFEAGAEDAVAARIAEAVRGRRIGYAYGSLASGADILWAEALLDAGSEVHVVLPCAREEFVEVSVAPAGGRWVERFERCLAAATSVRHATEDALRGDDVVFRYGSDLAMGLALLRARYLDAEVRQLAVWDGAPARGAAGTSIDVATWRRTGMPVTLVAPDGGSPAEFDRIEPLPRAPVPVPTADISPGSAGRRAVGAMLFGDIRGFSKLNDDQMPRFAETVLAAFAEALDKRGGAVWWRNTMGDALYAVLEDAACAAACALEIQEAVARIDFGAHGLPDHLALRLGAHLGPVLPVYEPVRKDHALMGSHVTRTARIEPVTPPGMVYVTEVFAAALMLDGHREFSCDYVGHMAAAKDYGRLRMYRLRRVPAPVG